MENYNSVLTSLRWNAGELLPGHKFCIHDFAVKKDSGKIVLLTGVFRNGEHYCCIGLDDLETETVPFEIFRKPENGEITTDYEILKKKLICIKGYQGKEYWQKLLKKFKSTHSI